MNGYAAAYDESRTMTRPLTIDEMNDDIQSNDSMSDSLSDVNDTMNDAMPSHHGVKHVSVAPDVGDWVYAVSVSEVLRLSECKMESAAAQRRSNIIANRKNEIERMRAERMV